MKQEQKQKFFERLGITPGPWYKDHSSENGWPIVEDGYDFSIAMMSIYQIQKAEANSTLIKEAPEMFLALVETARFLEANINYMPDDDKDFQRENRNLLVIILSVLEQASGKPWQEVKKIYEECL